MEYMEGYVACPYTYGYYRELNPYRAALPLLRNGLALPRFRRACELGFGQGVSVNINAAASAIHWHGNDFNSQHAAFARKMAAISGAELSDQPFAEFCARKDLPDFDFIGLHGVWSWVSQENRRIIAGFIDRKLAAGGLLYISYNTQPGWAKVAPLRELMAAHAALAGGDFQTDIKKSLAFARGLASQGPEPAALLPWLEDLDSRDPAYLAHEYFNADWHATTFAQMSRELPGLDYVCQASYLDNLDFLNLSPGQIALLNKIENGPLRESARDYLLASRFRRDYWLRGARLLPPKEARETLAQSRFALLLPAETARLKIRGQKVETDLNPEIFAPILEIFADMRPHSVLEAAEKLAGRGAGINQVLDLALALCANGQMTQIFPQDPESLPRCQKINAFISGMALSDTPIEFLASPAAAGGMEVPGIFQIFLDAPQDMDSPEKLAGHAAEKLLRAGIKLTKDGQELAPGPETEKELSALARDFLARLPGFRTLGLAP